MTTYTTLKVTGELRSSSIFFIRPIFAGIEKETEKAAMIGFISEGSLACYKSWVPKSCISIEDDVISIKSWFFEKEIEHKILRS